MEQDIPLDVEAFDMSATRPPMLFGLPYGLTGTLLLGGLVFLMGYDTGDVTGDFIVDAIAVGVMGIIWTSSKIMLRDDYHAWHNFIAWLRLDFRMFDTSDWGGAHLSSLPLRSIYRSEVYNVH